METLSFFHAGFECATGYNSRGEWIDQVRATGHDEHVHEDYRRVVELGINVVREGVRWPLVDRKGRYDFSTVLPCAEAARELGITVIWDLFHFGFPPELDPLSEEFLKRFSEYCFATARFLDHYTGPVAFFTPVNEPSYFAYAAGEVGHFAPYRTGLGWEMKVAVARAAIEGVNALRAASPRCRIVQVDPICRVAPPVQEEDEEVVHAVEDFNRRIVFQSFDMMSGALLPELGGSRAHLDLVGVNYYPCNQWEIGNPHHPLAWDDPRRVPMSTIVTDVWRRYGGEVLITETGERDEMRRPWFERVVHCSARLIGERVPFRGVCLYPALGMPEWHAQDEWARMGIWDIVRENGWDRIPLEAFHDAVSRAAKHRSFRGGLPKVPFDPEMYDVREERRGQIRVKETFDASA